MDRFGHRFWSYFIIGICLVGCVSETQYTADTTTSPQTLDQLTSRTEVDHTLPIPSVTMGMDKGIDKSADTLILTLNFTHFTLRPILPNGPNVPGAGYAHLHIVREGEDEQLLEITSKTVEIPADSLQSVRVALNANDGSLWTLKGEEIGAALTVDVSADTTHPIQSNNLTYILGWKNVTDTITNDLGYTITLDEAYLTNATAELVECPVQQSWFTPRTAYAGHGDFAISETRSLLNTVEALHENGVAVVGEASASEMVYCQVHYLVAGAAESTANVPTADYIGKTFSFSGNYDHPNHGTTPFSLETTLAWGGIFDLPAPIEPTNQPITLHLDRNWATLFDGVDFIKMSADEQEKAILRSLINQTTVRSDTARRVTTDGD